MKLAYPTGWRAIGLVLALLGCRKAPQASPSPATVGAVPTVTPAPVAARDQARHGYRLELVDETGDARHAGELREWVDRATQAVSETTGGSAQPVRIVVREGTGGASTRGRIISMALPEGPRPPHPGREWVLHHELIHASFPGLPARDLWLEEGLATYLEPLLRVRARQLDTASMWRDLAEQLPQGAPRRGEGGLAGTETWHRLYWQGALFWLNAEIEVYRRTQGRRSLHDALCAWARADGDAEDWSTERAFAIMDHALGTPILLALYRGASARGIEHGPSELLQELGVGAAGEGVRLESNAPAAELRRMMTTVSARPCIR
jgi:hypothetical protein